MIFELFAMTFRISSTPTTISVTQLCVSLCSSCRKYLDIFPSLHFAVKLVDLFG